MSYLGIFNCFKFFIKSQSLLIFESIDIAISTIFFIRKVFKNK